MRCAAFAIMITSAFAANCGPAASKLEVFEGTTLDDTMDGTDICSGTCTQVTSVQAGKASQTLYVKMGVISQLLTLQVHADSACATVASTYTPPSTAESDKIKAGSSAMVNWASGDKTSQFKITVTGGCYSTRCTTTTSGTATGASNSVTSNAAGVVQSALTLAIALLAATSSM